MKVDCTQSLKGQIDGERIDTQKFFDAILFHFYGWKYNK